MNKQRKKWLWSQYIKSPQKRRGMVWRAFKRLYNSLSYKKVISTKESLAKIYKQLKVN